MVFCVLLMRRNSSSQSLIAAFAMMNAYDFKRRFYFAASVKKPAAHGHYWNFTFSAPSSTVSLKKGTSHTVRVYPFAALLMTFIEVGPI